MRFYRHLFTYLCLVPLTWGKYSREFSNSNVCFERQERFDTDSGAVEIHWMVDSDSETVKFEFDVETERDSIAFGFSHLEKLSQREPVDFVLGGIDKNGEEYLTDMSIRVDKEGKFEVFKDSKEDYNLMNISRSGEHLKISFLRQWNTQDPRDVTFDMSLVYMIWFDLHIPISYKEENTTESIFYIDPEAVTHHLPLYILDPDYSKTFQNERNVKTWNIRKKLTVPAKPTTYWCEVHKFPERLTTKHHIIGFRTVLNDELTERHTHHLVIYKCDTNMTQENMNKFFQPLVNDGGSDCYDLQEKRLPIENCRTFAYVWGYGGKELFLPNDVGFPIGDNEDEYYILETHFDNPRSLNNLQIEVGVEVYYTNNLRKNDAGLFVTGYTIFPSLIIPPESDNMVIVGHCKPRCTQKHIPDDGIEAFGMFLHTHTTGRKISMDLISSNGNETSEKTLIDDNHYNFRFQAARLLMKRERIFPGDHLVTKCAYNTKWKNTTTLGGLGTNEEMCLSFVWYYPKIPNFNGCLTGLPFGKGLQKFGIENVKPSYQNKNLEWVVTEPAKFLNRSLQDVLDNDISWTTKLRDNLAMMYQDDNLQQNHDQC